jgi:hypothetical protein
VINISNFTSKDKPPWPAGQPAHPTRPPAPMPPSRAIAERPVRVRVRVHVRLGRPLVLTVALMLSWLAAIPRRLGDRLFAMNDNEAYWRGWQITPVHGGLGRRYRDPRFDTLAECATCWGAGVIARALCVPCDGIGRVTLGEVS